MIKSVLNALKLWLMLFLPSWWFKIDEPEDSEEEQQEQETEIETNTENITDNENMTKKVLVCLDNGHGEETPGKRSPYAACKVPPALYLREYEYCREIVKMLKERLEADGYEVFVVTPETSDPKLSERANRINKTVTKAKAEGKHSLMISIHNNAAGKGDKWMEAYGWSAWTTKGQNNSDILATCLFDAAKEVLTPLGQKTRSDWSDKDPDYEENFTIIYKSNCPAVLTENMFQDCIKEVEFLLSDQGKDAIVEIHRRGIEKFCEKMGW